MTLSEKAHLKRLKALERTSSADLEALLLLDFQSPESSEAEIDKILRAAEILAERAHRQNSGDADRAWKVFLEKLRIKGLQIIENNVKIDINGDVCTAEGDYVVEESAVQEQAPEITIPEQEEVPD